MVGKDVVDMSGDADAPGVVVEVLVLYVSVEDGVCVPLVGVVFII